MEVERKKSGDDGGGGVELEAGGGGEGAAVLAQVGAQTSPVICDLRKGREAAGKVPRG